MCVYTHVNRKMRLNYIYFVSFFPSVAQIKVFKRISVIYPFFPGKSHGPRSLAGHKRVGHDLVTARQQSVFEYSSSFIPLIIPGVYLVSSWWAGVGFGVFFFFLQSRAIL